MRALVAEDEFLGRKVLSVFLNTLFEVDVVVNGLEAVEAFKLAHQEGRPYDLLLMDIMMPEMDGLEALRQIRAMEQEQKIRPAVRALMTTALDDPKTVIRSFHDGEASGYIVKPVRKDKLFEELKKLGFITD
ncbi:two-component system, chemotaxis family, response regulator CheY [Humidesulfovibrio mexicanus]|uniref:Two-component system, chemotaxis family, response regulator CheY n=1 Tax=Humidesulfovibrio mexicanus TaxID=147047 RepID=A0A239BG31_9BACT|nr:response regulator [Humidesulfovibrio mexicanus]SNS06880.1 two-component system, chemotaxis family, response regulator CheY [Humidesulfovibrio mexicanus]